MDFFFIILSMGVGICRVHVHEEQKQTAACSGADEGKQGALCHLPVLIWEQAEVIHMPANGALVQLLLPRLLCTPHVHAPPLQGTGRGRGAGRAKAAEQVGHPARFLLTVFTDRPWLHRCADSPNNRWKMPRLLPLPNPACRQYEAGSEEALLDNASSDLADPERQHELQGLQRVAKEQ